jgi:hypothetical protein
MPAAPTLTGLAASSEIPASSGFAKMSILAGAGGSSLIKGVQALTLAHPVMLLGALGGALLLVGAVDAVRGHRAKQAMAAGPAEPAEAAAPAAPL